jgi:hypothetical protein
MAIVWPCPDPAPTFSANDPGRRVTRNKRLVVFVGTKKAQAVIIGNKITLKT